MRASLARISVLLAAILFFAGLLSPTLCYCPGWFIVSGALAGVSTGLGLGRIRAWAVLWLVASITMFSLQSYWQMQLRERARIARSRQRESQGTNEMRASPPKVQGRN